MTYGLLFLAALILVTSINFKYNKSMKKELSDLDKQTIRELISTTAICDICDINEKTSFTKDLFLDSLDKVEVFMVVESSFNIHISDIDIEECETVGQLFNLVAEKL